MRLDRRSFVRFSSAGLTATGLSSIERLDLVCAHEAPAKNSDIYQEGNGPIFVSRRLQRGYNPKGPYLPIRENCTLRKLFNAITLQKSRKLSTVSMAYSVGRTHLYPFSLSPIG